MLRNFWKLSDLKKKYCLLFKNKLKTLLPASRYLKFLQEPSVVSRLFGVLWKVSDFYNSLSPVLILFFKDIQRLPY